VAARRTGGDRYQDGGRGRGTDEPQPRRRLCNGGLSRGLAEPHDRGERPARLVPPARLLLHSPPSVRSLARSLARSPPPFSLRDSFSLADSSLSSRYHGTTNANRASEGYDGPAEANKCATERRGTSFRPGVIALA